MEGYEIAFIVIGSIAALCLIAIVLVRTYPKSAKSLVHKVVLRKSNKAGKRYMANIDGKTIYFGS